jgi:outer membrane biosynthesis protein TonB
MKEAAGNVFYAVVGAPVVASRGIAKTGTKVVSIAKNEYEAFASEGRKVTERLRKNPMVDEINSRVDLDSVQDRVDKLRDQMEDLLANWRDSFTPESQKPKSTKAPTKSTKKPDETDKSKKAESKAESKKAESKAESKKAESKAESKKAESKAESTKVEADAEAADEGAAPA